MKRAFTRIALFLMIVSQIVCAAAQAPLTDHSAEKANLREAIFRHMFQRYDYGPHVKVYCVQPDRPLTDNFLRKFAEARFPWSGLRNVNFPAP